MMSKGMVRPLEGGSTNRGLATGATSYDTVFIGPKPETPQETLLHAAVGGTTAHNPAAARVPAIGFLGCRTNR